METSNFKYLILIIYFYLFFRLIMINIALLLAYLSVIVILVLPRKLQLKLADYDSKKISNASFLIGKTMRKIQKFIPDIIKVPNIEIFDKIEKIFFNLYASSHSGYIEGISSGLKQLKNNNNLKENNSFSFLVLLFFHILLFLPTIIGIILIIYIINW